MIIMMFMGIWVFVCKYVYGEGHRESNPCKRKIRTINQNDDDDDDIYKHNKKSFLLTFIIHSSSVPDVNLLIIQELEPESDIKLKILP